MDKELEMAAAIKTILDHVAKADSPTPRTGTLVYLSGRWKVRDGWMYGQ